MRLSRQTRAAFFSGNWPELAGKGIPPVQVGYVHVLSPRLSFEVVRVHLRRGRWRLEYRVLDDREQRFYLLPAAHSIKTDDRGEAMNMPPEEELGYTRNPRRARADELPSIPPDLNNVSQMRSRLHSAEHDRSVRPDKATEQDLRRLSAELRELVKRAAKMGVDPLTVVAPVAREIANQHEHLKDAA